MVELIIIEGHEEMVWNWICNNETRRPKSDRPYDKYDWKKISAWALAQAKAKDLEGSLDDAIRVLLRIYAMRSVCYVPILPLQLVLFKGLTDNVSTTTEERRAGDDIRLSENAKNVFVLGQPRYPKTSPEIWQHYYNLYPWLYRCNSGIDRLVEDKRSTMWLHHRQSPNPLPFLEFLRKVDADEGDWYHRAQKPSSRNNLSIRCELCALLLHSQGLTSNVCWVEDFVDRKFAETKRYWKRSFINPKVAKSLSKRHYPPS